MAEAVDVEVAELLEFSGNEKPQVLELFSIGAICPIYYCTNSKTGTYNGMSYDCNP